MTGEIETVEGLLAHREAFIQALRSAKRVAICSHLNPDGDAIGSALAVGHFLSRLGVEWDVFSHDPVPDNLRFLPGTDLIQTELGDPTLYDLGVIVDLDSLERLGKHRAVFEAIPTTIVVDHHVPHDKPGSMRLVMVSAPATCAILADLMVGSEVGIDTAIAECLLAGILTDTGNFRFPNTTPHSLNLAAQLIESGANLPRMAEEVYHRRPIGAVRLLGWSLNAMKSAMDEQIVWTCIPRAERDALGAREQDTEGIVNELLSIKTARIAAVMREAKTDGLVRASVRSRGDIDVAGVARQIGGGGHRNAAGITFHGTLAEAETAIIEALKACLASS
jgi:phosphoesterase RecJ-like protein